MVVILKRLYEFSYRKDLKGPFINDVGNWKGGGEVIKWSKLPTDSTKKLPT